MPACLYTHVHRHIRRYDICITVQVGLHVCYAFMYVFTYVHTHIRRYDICISVQVGLHVCYAFMYVFTYVHTHIHRYGICISVRVGLHVCYKFMHVLRMYIDTYANVPLQYAIFTISTSLVSPSPHCQIRIHNGALNTQNTTQCLTRLSHYHHTSTFAYIIAH
jgi:hypothetical protein